VANAHDAATSPAANADCSTGDADGSRVACADLRGVEIWDVPTGVKKLTLEPTQDRVTGLAITDPGHILASSMNGRVTVWGADD